MTTRRSFFAHAATAIGCAVLAKTSVAKEPAKCAEKEPVMLIYDVDIGHDVIVLGRRQICFTPRKWQIVQGTVE